MSKRKPLSQNTIKKNRAFLGILLFVVVLFFGLSIVRMKENARVQQTTTLRLHK